MLNAVLLAELANHIAEYFSEDAAFWSGAMKAQSKGPVLVQWVAGEKGSIVPQIVDALRTRTLASFRSTNRPDAVAIVAVRPEERPDAIVTFWSDVRPDDGPGLRYELSLDASGTVWPGWFRV